MIVNIRFPKDLHERVRERAELCGCTFQAMVIRCMKRAQADTAWFLECRSPCTQDGSVPIKLDIPNELMKGTTCASDVRAQIWYALERCPLKPPKPLVLEDCKVYEVVDSE